MITISPHPHQYMLFSLNKNSSHSEWVYSGILLYFWISIMSNNTIKYYSCACWPFVYHLWRNIFFSSLLISKLDCLSFSLLSCKSSLFLFGYSTLSDIRFANIFSHSMGSFYSWQCSLIHTSFKFQWSPIYFSFVAYDFGIIIWESVAKSKIIKICTCVFF